MSYHFIHDEIKIDFTLPEGIQQIITIVEKLDLLGDSEYLNYASTLKTAIAYYAEKGELTKEPQELLNQRYPAII